MSLESDAISKIWAYARSAYPDNRQRAELRIFHGLFRTAHKEHKQLEELTNSLIEAGSISGLRAALEGEFTTIDPEYILEAFSEVSHSEIASREITEHAKQIAAEAERKRLALEVERITARLTEALEESVCLANELNDELNHEALVDYPTLRRERLAQLFKGFQFADEQLDAIGVSHPSYLLRARAGSGKTKVIVQKALFLMQHEGISPDDILILAFNKKAAEEINERLGNATKWSRIPAKCASTFHSLAFRLCDTQNVKLLSDKPTGTSQTQDAFLQSLIKESLNPDQVRILYSAFRAEAMELDRLGEFLSDADYYTFRREMCDESLDGTLVKSKGEKWIADFLFEHGFSFQYEPLEWNAKKVLGSYHPDFFISSNTSAPDVFLEHWGIDERDPGQSVPPEWSQSWSDYVSSMSAKRSYWAKQVENPNRHISFCETSVVDMRGGRARFEAVLKNRLQNAGFRVERRPEIELFADVVRKKISRITKMCVGFIQRAKKNNMSPEDLLTLSRDVNKNDERSLVFVQFAASVYNRYEIEKRRQGYIDFDDILVQARQFVVNREGQVHVYKTRESEISLQNLKYIFIDEYQDFSPLFYELVKTIRDFNQQIKFFCVGDDWQAINKFAGSDLKYFNEFPGFFCGSSTGVLVQNYRSVEGIVDLGNRLMGNRGAQARATRKGQKALVATVDVGNVFVEKREHPPYQIQYQEDLRFRSFAQGGGKTVDTDRFSDIARRLKAIHTIILDPVWTTTPPLQCSRGRARLKEPS
jgi:DNA helicase IV